MAAYTYIVFTVLGTILITFYILANLILITLYVWNCYFYFTNKALEIQLSNFLKVTQLLNEEVGIWKLAYTLIPLRLHLYRAFPDHCPCALWKGIPKVSKGCSCEW